MSERVNFEEEKVLIIGGAKLTADPKTVSCVTERR